MKKKNLNPCISTRNAPFYPLPAIARNSLAHSCEPILKLRLTTESANLLAMFSCLLFLSLISFSHKALAQKSEPVPLANLKTKSAGTGSIVKTNVSKDDTVIVVDLRNRQIGPDSLLNYIWAPVVNDTKFKTSLFYNQMFTTPAIDSLFAGPSDKIRQISTEKFFEVVSFLEKMQIKGKNKIIPNARSLRERGIQIYKLSGNVPIAILDVDFELAGRLNAKGIGINENGQFVALKKFKPVNKSILLAAPMIQAVASSTTRIIFPKELVITNRKSTYSVSLADNKTEKIEFGKAITINSTKSTFPITVRSGEGKAISTSIGVVSLGVLPARRFAVLRSVSAENHLTQQLTIAGTTLGPEMEGPDMTWKPGSAGCGDHYEGRFASLTSVSEAAGYEIGVWLSDKNRNAPEDAVDIEPLFVLGGQDWETNDPQSLFNAFKVRMGDDVIAQLLTRFDIFTLSYWTGGAVTTDGEARARGIRRSVQDNAALLADALRFLYCEMDIKKKSVFIGISMGGNVSRLAFLGIENGPIVSPTAGETYRQIPNFPSQVVPVRLWITIDTPHRGATIPVGFQDWVGGFDFLPGMEDDIALLNSPATKELLVPHRSGNSLTGITNKRKNLLTQQDTWGNFPSTIDCSIAVSSGNFDDIPRENLWELDNGKIDNYTIESDSYWDTVVKSIQYGCEPRYVGFPNLVIGGIRFGRTYFDLNSWVVKNNISTVAGQTSLEMKSYKPLGPGSLPLMYSSAHIPLANNSLFNLSLQLRSTISERTYPENSFEEVNHPEFCNKIGFSFSTPFGDISTDELGKIRQYSAYVEANMHGEFDVDLPFIDPVTINFHTDYSKPHRFAAKPYGLEVGGYRDTGRQIMDRFNETLGSSFDSHLFSPRHCFVPTISALDLGDDFLKNAFREFAENNPEGFAGHDFLYDRALSSSFKPDHLLEYRHVEKALVMSGITWKKSENLVLNFDNGTSWSGRPSPFNYVVVQKQSLPHTFFDDASKAFIVESIFRDNCEGKQFVLPAFNPKTLEWLRNVQIPPFFGWLPPIPWCDDFPCIKK